MAKALRIERPLMFAGIVTVTAGMVFGLQGHGMLGPQSSFMHADPQWGIYGRAIILAGAAMILSSMIIRIKKGS